MPQTIRATLLALALLLASPTAVEAGSEQDREQASERVEEGLRHARAGRYEEAAAHFEDAFKLYPHPDILHNLARAREELRELSTAWALFRKALNMDSGYTFADDARKRLEGIADALRQTHGLLRIRSTPSRIELSIVQDGETIAAHLGTPVEYWVEAGAAVVQGSKSGHLDTEHEVDVQAGSEQDVEVVLRPVPKKGFLTVTSGGVEGAVVKVDGERVGTTPMATFAYPSGSHRVRVEAEGYEPHEEAVVVEPDRETRVAAALSPVGGAEAGAVQTVRASDESEGVNRTLVGGVLLGGGAATLVTGALLHVSAFKKAQDASSVPNDPTSTADDERFDKLADEAERRQAIAFAGYGLSAVLLGVGTWMMLSESAGGDEATEAAGVRWTPTAGPTADGFGVGAALRF